MGNRGDIDKNDLYGSLGGHLRDFYGKSSVIRKEGYGERIDPDDYADYTPKDITGSGKKSVNGPADDKRSSDRIQIDICKGFTLDRNLDASFVEVYVIGDEVHLEGYVPSRPMKFLAEKLAAEVPGVTKIINQLKIRNAISSRIP